MAVCWAFIYVGFLFNLAFSSPVFTDSQPERTTRTTFLIEPSQKLKVCPLCPETDISREFDWPDVSRSLKPTISSQNSVLLKRLRNSESTSGEIPLISFDIFVKKYLFTNSFTSSIGDMNLIRIVKVFLIAFIFCLCLVLTILSAIHLGKSMKMEKKCNSTAVPMHSLNHLANRMEPALIRV